MSAEFVTEGFMPNRIDSPEQHRYLMETHSGKVIDLADIYQDDIEIEDIAYALSMICRWGGQGQWISVAAHSVAMADFALSNGREKMALECLMHDAAEAYLGDTIGPLRKYLVTMERFVHKPLSDFPPTGVLENLHEGLNGLIGDRFGLVRPAETVSFAKHPVVMMIDRLAFDAELLQGWGRKFWQEPTPAPELFVMYHALLCARQLEDDGSPRGRDAIRTKFLTMFKDLQAARKS